MDRDMAIKLGVVDQVVNKELIEDLYHTQPMACNLLLNTFKDFLLDSRFRPIERQLVLLRFLSNNYPLELSRDIVQTVASSYLRDDYVRVILEWNYNSSDFIKQSAVKVFDTSQLAYSKIDKDFIDKLNRESNKKLEVMQEITDLLLNHLSNSEGSDE